ncbi:haloalkane dehalogenase [Cupriavidus sp. D39]|uniref:haloalkane dehalogenase n=1 Tax=Cupriavidus sp. D39 TaxID=2997877 RepID=UPI002271497A|nr:haloalkane dehalogenase [Cupriavidus sp. D39]MCY0854974.1 haloalkane dehalogenase [Cupriavidus sp. D39]
MFSTDEQPKRFCESHGKKMAYVDVGDGKPVVFLHGNPTSSYIWRNVIPHVAPYARCIAPDLIGMGDSEKLEEGGADRYSFVEHRRFLDSFLESVDAAHEVVMVAQDWGGALAMDWARRHARDIRGIAYMETMVRTRTWDEMDPIVRGTFERLRSSEGEDMVLRDNVFIEKLLPARMLRELTEAEMNVYRRPYLRAGDDRLPTLTFPREIPVDGKPELVARVVSDYSRWMAEADVPKLFINGEPGGVLVGEMRDLCRTWNNQEEVTVRGSHFLQEDSPHEIGIAIAEWLRKLP